MNPIVHVSGTVWLLAPALGALMAAGWACFAQRSLAPHDATRMLAVLAAVTTIGVIGGLFTVSIGFLTQFAAIDRTFGWCRSLAAHPVSTAAGVGALASLAYSLPAGIRAARRYRRASRFDLSDASGDTNSIVIVDSARPLAYASPGGRGHVVVSEGMLAALTPDEQRAMLAHEEAHLLYRHHRYLAVAYVSAAALPLLRPLIRQLRFAMERCADNHAVAVIGDSTLVARAIARAALAANDPPPAWALALTGSGTRARVEALLDGRRPSTAARRACTALGAMAVAVNLTGASVQLHHLYILLTDVCQF